MKSIWKFRLLALLFTMLVGGVSFSNLTSSLLRPDPAPLPSREVRPIAPHLVAAAKLASYVAPFRTDLKAGYAIALADQALTSEHGGQTSDNERAQTAVISALKLGPHDSRMWLVLAQLKAWKDLSDPLVTESLKMSYLTGPSRAELIPIRLDSATVGNSLNDADLTELARGDVRAVLTRYPDQRQALINDYGRASVVGKAFLEASTRTLDPAFADLLRSSK